MKEVRLDLFKLHDENDEGKGRIRDTPTGYGWFYKVWYINPNLILNDRR